MYARSPAKEDEESALGHQDGRGQGVQGVGSTAVQQVGPVLGFHGLGEKSNSNW